MAKKTQEEPQVIQTKNERHLDVDPNDPRNNVPASAGFSLNEDEPEKKAKKVKPGEDPNTNFLKAETGFSLNEDDPEE